MSIFDIQIIARNYDKGRPHFSPIVMDRIRRVVGSHRHFGHVADINCGMGESTLALRTIADRISASHPTAAMLELAPPDPKITYQVNSDQQLDLPDASVDFALLHLAFHWLERKNMARELHRVLKPGAWLVIYQNAFSGTMHFCPEFTDWYHGAFQEKMGFPFSEHQELTMDEAEDYGFDWVERERYSHDVMFTKDELVHYLLTHVTANDPELDDTSDAELNDQWEENKKWLDAELKAFFRKKGHLFPFGGSIWYLKSRAQ
ncbi:MAG: class I SAM-dependent methyltransferase [Verrucomicrobiota bacterium]